MLSPKIMIPFSKYWNNSNTDFTKKARNTVVQACEIDKAEKVSVGILLGRLQQLNKELTTQARQNKFKPEFMYSAQSESENSHATQESSLQSSALFFWFNSSWYVHKYESSPTTAYLRIELTIACSVVPWHPGSEDWWLCRAAFITSNFPPKLFSPIRTNDHPDTKTVSACFVVLTKNIIYLFQDLEKKGIARADCVTDCKDMKIWNTICTE